MPLDELLKSIAITHPFTSAFVVMLVLMLLLPLVIRVTRKYRVYWFYLFVAVAVFAWAYERANLLYFYVFMLGMLTAFSEIVSKFSDEPIKALGSAEALAYHLTNGAIACFALMLLSASGFGASTLLDKIKLVTAAGLGSMLIMRSRLFNAKVAGEDVAFGPEQIVRLFFRFMERSIDRIRAEARVEFVTEQMSDLDFDKIYDYTVTMLNAAQAWDEKEKEKTLKQIEEIKKSNLSNMELKSFELGFILLNTMGEAFLSTLYVEKKAEWRLRAPIVETRTTLLERLTNKQPPLYFSYGSNMSTQTFLSRLGRTDYDVQSFEKIVRPAKGTLRGYRVVFNRPSSEHSGHSDINLEVDENGRVEGVIYNLNKEALEYLNHTEPGYSLQIVKVTGPQQKEVECQAFVYNGPREERPPERSYFNSLLRGAQERGLSPEYIETLKAAASGTREFAAPSAA